MRCLKAFGERISAPGPDRQAAEIQFRVARMNRFSALGTVEIMAWHEAGGNGANTPQAGVTNAASSQKSAKIS
jgi:hypothetical protein